MELFDSLPAEVRRAIAAASFPFHPRIALRFLKRGFGATRVARLIAVIDRRLAKRII
ncbi:DUF6525 family protein [Rhizobium sp. RU36D]|uniref:DUF6525 family protein n=1 Tax=Rhizobium sp. RU36D TaxID=1907415 RepID=UPI0009D84651|nr:DUF6525 family protein [Rhizobium sp. RU36D]SMD18218.1 hypothetical protein SAMN05880593_13441 [Rhizobium sp. RU36D]